MAELARSGALPPGAWTALVVLAVMVAGILVLEHLPLDAYGLYRHAKPPPRPRWWHRRTMTAEPEAIEPPRPPGRLRPDPPPTPPPPTDDTWHAPAPRVHSDGNGQGNGAGQRLRLVPPSQGGQFSEEYRRYLRGEIPSPIDNKRWPDRIGPWKDEHRAKGGVCDIGRVLARGGQPNCGSRVPLVHMDTDHVDYEHLFCERREDVVFGCRACHDRREYLKKHKGLDIYEAWGLP